MTNVAAAASTEQDIAHYLRDIAETNRRYTNLVARARKLEKGKGKGRDDDVRMEISSERKTLKASFIRSKQTARALFKLLPEAVALVREEALKTLQQEFRELDNELKSLHLQLDRSALGLPDFEVGAPRRSAAP